MKKKNILIAVLIIIVIAAYKIESQKPGEVKFIKEDFDLDIMDKYDGGNIVNFGSNVYSLKGDKDTSLRLKLRSFDNGNEDAIFDIGLGSLEEGEKLGFEISSNELNVYVISDKKISQVTKFDFDDQIYSDSEFRVWEWTEGGSLKEDEPFPLLAAFLADSNDFSTVGLENPDFYSELRNKKDLSALVLDVKLESTEK